MTWETEARYYERRIAALELGVRDLDAYLDGDLVEIAKPEGERNRPMWQLQESIVRRWARRRGMVVELDALVQLRSAMDARHPADTNIVEWTTNQLRADRG